MRGTGNIPTLLDTQLKTPLPALVAAELSGSDTDIPPASAIRIAQEGSLIEPGVRYIFFWIDFRKFKTSAWCWVCDSQLTNSQLTKFPETPLAVNERLMTIRIPLAKGRRLNGNLFGHRQNHLTG